VVVASDAAGGGVLVVVGEEVAVESAGGLDAVEVAGTGLADGAASMMTVLVEVAVRPAWSVATY
jgi:hypothetical protein